MQGGRHGTYRPQSYTSCVYMLPEPIWRVLLDNKIDILTKARVVLQFLKQRLGLRQASEPTRATVAALCVVAEEGAVKARALGSDFLRDLFKHISAMHKQISPPPARVHL